MTSEERDEVKQVVQEVLQEEGVAIDDNTIFPMKNSAGQSDALLMMQLDQQHQATDYSRINAENLTGGGGGSITIDPVPTEDSSNAVASGGVYDALEEKQEKLASGLNIKTINGQSIVGEGNLVTESDTVPFDGFILLSPITIIDGSVVDPDAILYYRDVNRFVAKKGNKYYNNWVDRLLYNNGNAPYTSKLYPYDGAVYTWDGTTFAATGGTSVRYDAQTLTTQQKAQARSNIATIGYEAQTLTTQQKEQAAQNIGLGVVVKGDVQQSLSDAQKVQAQNNMMGKAYAPAQNSGLGKVYLDKNNGVLTQAMMQATNTVYVIQYDYTIGGNITVPAGCTLWFDGGSISGAYTLTGNNTDIKNDIVKCFGTDTTVSGTWIVDMWYAEWFGAKADGTTDNTNIFNHIFNMFKNGFVLKLLKGVYIANQIDISECKNITIIGYSDSVIRIDPVYTTKEKSSLIRCTQNVDFIIQTEKYTNNTWHRSEGITIKNVGLDGADKATTGFVCTFGTYLSCVTVSRCKGNGIETGYSAYPTFLEKCISERNGQHGFYAGPENDSYTTAYWIRDCEFIFNKGYGMYLAQGSSCKFDACLYQSNWQGGLKIKPKSATRWLSFLNFDSCYFENNGLYEISDEEYDGNYMFCIEGDNTNPQVFAGKIPYIVFHCCTFNKSEKVSDFNDSYKIIGTTNLICTNNAIIVDPLYNNEVHYYNKNIISGIRIGSLVDTSYNYTIDTSNSFVYCVKNENVASYKIKIVYNKNLTPGEYYAGENQWSGIRGLKLYSLGDEVISVKVTNTSDNTSETIQSKHIDNLIDFGKLGNQLPEQGIIEASYTLILNDIS